ncbi:hypothetical protein D4764_15G0006330 [Takifugu flavidus]|uniref:Chemokine interleukin-8-like domain-containing protein n=1 Tax=Takifugu flavidus TaxID=433684 RepID=A0A5C6P2X3_9TELE|nr:hypothetical protein D4764_15G0006330 [Takifugu flavidus]
MVSFKDAVMAITLITLCVLATHTSLAHPGCCSSYMKSRIPFRIIKGYSVQTVTEICPIDAIIFHTALGKACTNPASKWVMAYIQKLSNKARKVHKTSQKQKEHPF